MKDDILDLQALRALLVCAVNTIDKVEEWRKVAEGESVPIPRNHRQAQLMEYLGRDWLKHNAPETQPIDVPANTGTIPS